jgi:hypothetical protein
MPGVRRSMIDVLAAKSALCDSFAAEIPIMTSDIRSSGAHGSALGLLDGTGRRRCRAE